MNYSIQYLTELANRTHFIKDNLEKVVRLTDILRFMNENKAIKGKLALKGGTAINLTVSKMPRLSMDIDMDFASNFSKLEILKEREAVKSVLIRYLEQQGYMLSDDSREYYALISLIFQFRNNAGNIDNIKIEINFMNRCHILPLVYRPLTCGDILGDFDILSLDIYELYASKINALISRWAPRDLYDVYMMVSDHLIADLNMLKKCLVFYNMIGGEQNIDNLNLDKINSINFFKFKRELKPVLSKDDPFDLDVAKKTVIVFLKEISKLNSNEIEFVSNFKEGIYKPELLFPDRDLSTHPMALWRCSKLK
jgi:predicted nucleotidyltransferase component of viral defense system